MTLGDSVSAFGKLSVAKTEFLARNPLGFWVAAMMAGAYVGMGILLIFSVGQNADPALRNLIMGVSFGIALTLVVFAGSELFTGYTMYMAIGRLTGRIRTVQVLRAWAATWFGNLGGSVLLGALFVAGGGGVVLQAGGQDLLHAVAAKKMTAPAFELFVRAMLCNWLVCLAIWGASRTQNDAAKCLIIFWCLFAFIAAGFEHSVANMTVFSVALLSEHPDKVSLFGAGRNLLWVTLGNTASGALFMGYGYWLAAGRPVAKSTAGTDEGRAAITANES
ncbi:nitrite transporter NirC [Pelagibius sp. Alg239-R121]|uniref:nitrite transporter NirC n=1 Tax=Pelagibius sp. Alg239-R121 TaxID=2993448 RepID=UPI0024A693E7|nr:nitrite transporter NirC [Pelagibius sp. Alg239-R121]